MTSPQQRSKAWGYAVEIAVLKSLKPTFPKLRRVGSIGYTKAAADLRQDGVGEPVRIIATRDKRRPILVSMSVTDFNRLTNYAVEPSLNVVIQVKGRARSWLGTLHDQLTTATKEKK